MMVRSTYPDEDQRTGVSHLVLPLRHLDHGELSRAGALAQNLPHLRKNRSEQHPDASMTHHEQGLVLFIQAGAAVGTLEVLQVLNCGQTIVLADGVRN